MTDNIVPIREGVSVGTEPGQDIAPNPTLIAQLESLLGDARSGQLLGMCVGSVYADQTHRIQWSGNVLDHELVAVAARLVWQINKYVDAEIYAHSPSDPPARGAA